jgi:trehalose synthase
MIGLDDYIPLVGEETVDRIRKKAEHLRGLHITHVNATYYGGGVAELLGSLTILMNLVGIKTGWRIIQGSPDFFSVTKKMHNAMQGGEINLSDRKMNIYEEVVYQNALRNHLDHDFVIIHDPQPLPMVNHYKKRGPWIWRCHVDMTSPDKSLWNYLVPFIENYDAVVFSLKDYSQELKTPQVFFMPAIDPFSIKNKRLSDREIYERLAHYNIPTDLPIVTQISRFDKWKDPMGVIEAFELARKEIDCRLVLLGNFATDDPEGEEVFNMISHKRSDRIMIIVAQDTALVNALQSKAAVVIQKSIREGFGLTVAEAMWKRAAVIGGNVGGIRCQIKDGINGFLVSSVEETAGKIVRLLKDRELAREFGIRGQETVQKNFLLTRLLEQYLDLFTSFETMYILRKG